MKIYLDIDGVIIDHNRQKLPFLKDFLTYLFSIPNVEIYWLSTHTHDGDAEKALIYLEDVMTPEIYEMLKKVKAVKWDTLKTEGIDLKEEFLWFDDSIFQSEYKVLESVHKEYCLIKVENNLEELTNLLKEDTVA